ncbi:MAG TPA: permease-like cell division protein FtsX [Thermoanaerobaculia bacterium]|nr:permease-like cell division protein FtsX [Thermoanaerobaculia bacterium]
MSEQIPSNIFVYFFREALRRIWVSKRSSFVAVAMITISLLIVGAFLLLSENLGRAVAIAQGKSRVEIYLTAEANASQIAAVDRYLAAHRDFGRRRFVSRDEALRRFSSYFSNLDSVVGQLDGNPFPPSFECDVAPQMVQSAIFAREVRELRVIAGVDDVQFDWEWVRRLKRVVNVINIVGLVAGGILALAAAFTIANVIRLTMMLYREEIAIMRLVGATEGIIRGPFLIEGLLQGVVGSILALLILFTAFVLARRFLPPANALVWSFLFNGFLPWQKIAALIAGGMLAGYFGSWLSVRESGEEPA